jgi:hypothetical protein
MNRTKKETLNGDEGQMNFADALKMQEEIVRGIEQRLAPTSS